MARTIVERRRFSVDDYYRMADAGILGDRERVELIDGEVVTISPIGRRHSACVSSANQALVLAAGTSAIVQPQGPVRLDRFNEPQPDLMLLKARSDFYASHHPGPSDVLPVVEIADSSLRYDTDTKAGLYATWGVPEYWVADLNASLLWRYVSPLDGIYTTITTQRRGETMAPQLLHPVRFRWARFSSSRAKLVSARHSAPRSQLAAGPGEHLANTRGRSSLILGMSWTDRGISASGVTLSPAWCLPLVLILRSGEGTAMLKTLVLAVVLAAASTSAFAQSQAAAPITKVNTKKATLTITAIDQKTRSVTLRAENGDEDSFTVGPAVERFNQLKVGDKINATYQESLVFELRKPGAPAATTGTTVGGERYKNITGGAVGAAHTVSVTVKAVDMNAPSITVVTADGHAITRMVQEKKNLENVKAGDRIDITYSEALILTAEAAAK